MSDLADDKFLHAARVLKALGHRLRLEIVCGLRNEPCTQTHIAEKLGLPQSTVAQHLKVLRSEGLVKVERRGVAVVFSLADPSFSELLETLCRKGGLEAPGRYSWDEIARLERERRLAGGY